MQDKRRWLPGWQRVELVELCLEHGLTRRQAAAWRRVSVSTVQYWIGRFARPTRPSASRGLGGGPPSTPHRQPARVSEEAHDRVCKARQRTGWGPRLIAAELGMTHATVSRCLLRRGLSRMPAPEREEVRRFEWPCPAICCRWTPSASRASPGPGTRSPVTAPHRRREAHAGRLGVLSLDDRRSQPPGLHRDPPRREGPDRHRVRRARARVVRRARNPAPAPPDRQRLDLRPQQQPGRDAATHGIQHRRIPPRTPKRNGKVERYQQTLAREWAYGQRYRNSDRREAALPVWLDHYNSTRNHSSLANRPPISRVRNHPRHDT